MERPVVKHIFFILITIISLSSCYTVSTFYISILEPAEIALLPDIRNISIYPGTTFSKSIEGNLDSIDNLRLNPDVNYYEFCKEYLVGLAEILDSSPRFDNVIIGDSLFIKNDNDPEILSWNDIIRICNEDSTDAVITLEYFYLQDFLNLNQFFTEECYVEYGIYNNSLWKIYNPKEFNIIEDYTSHDTIIWDAYSYYCDYALNKLPVPDVIINESCYWAGKKYGLRIAPLWYDNIQREYYISGNKYMRMANNNVKNNQWDDAVELWRVLANNTNKNLASKACYNIALACEVKDRLDLSYEWAKKSNNLYENIKTTAYIKVIEERIKNKEKLDKQMLDN